MKFRILWTDAAGEGKWTDMDAKSESEAVWKVALMQGELTQHCEYVDSWPWKGQE